MSQDSSLTDFGVEAISPILTDCKEDIEDVYMMCEMLKDQEISEKCGGHIHIGSDYLTSKEAYANLYEIWGNTENIMYLISNEAGKAPRRGVRITSKTSIKRNK